MLQRFIKPELSALCHLFQILAVSLGLYWAACNSLPILLIDRLADPVHQYPDIFGSSAFLTKYAYALPNLVTASMLFVSAIFGFLFLTETHDSMKEKRDLGMKIRQLFRRLYFRCRHGRPYRRVDATENNSIALSRSEVQSSDLAKPSPRPPLREIFTKQVLINMLVWACLAVQNNTYGQLFPVFCSTSVGEGGLGMRPGQIGAALSIAGVMAVIFQMTVFPWMYNKLGGLFCLRMCLGLYPPLYFVLPLRMSNLSPCHF
jgi:hypothetical protein